MALTVNNVPRFKGTVGGQKQLQNSAIADNGTNITLSRALSSTSISSSYTFVTALTSGVSNVGIVSATTVNSTEVIATSTTSTNLSATSVNIIGANFTGITFAASASGASAGLTGMAIIPQIAATTGSITYVNGIVVAVVNPT